MTTPTPKRVREATVTDRPILFSGPMIRAILAGQKTQTRRVVKLVGPDAIEERDDGSLWPYCVTWAHGDDGEPWYACPYGEPGDRLWVRETWAQEDARDLGLGASQTLYRATASDAEAALVQRWRPSIHMPRWASRLTLEVTSVRVERLQDITEDDARAEGAAAEPSEALADSPVGLSAREAFADLWASINGPASWAANPWVWVVGFKRIEVRHG